MKKHSGAEKAEVNLRMTDEGLNVTVRDTGCGFDLKQLQQNGGLGIRSMEERAHALGGKFEIRSESGKGTTLEAWVPLKPEQGLVKN